MRLGLSRFFAIPRDGYRLRFYPTALSAAMWLDPQRMTSEERLLKRCVEPGDAVIDVGANIGSMTLALAQVVGPQGRILSVEPGAAVFEVFERNIALNRAGDRVTPLNLALGAREGSVCLSDQHDDSQNQIVERRQGAPVTAMTTLDLVAPDGHIRLIKVDVEGYEGEVLRGAPAVCGRAEILFLECIPRLLDGFGWTEEALTGLIQGHGFRIFQAVGEELRAQVLGDSEKKLLLCLRDPEAFSARTGIALPERLSREAPARADVPA